MNNRPPNYFAYKKSKFQHIAQEPKKPISKLNFLFQLFIATFIIMFILIVLAIMKFSTKVDIEYSQNNFTNDSVQNATFDKMDVLQDDEQRQIDRRLSLIQQEENAPSEARIIDEFKVKNNEVIDLKHIPKPTGEEIKNDIAQKVASQQKAIIEDSKQDDLDEKKAPTPLAKIMPQIKTSQNVTIMSKVLIGHYSTFEEAKNGLNAVKTKFPSSSPFVKKIGETFVIQMGSYQDFAQAKSHAQAIKTEGFDVWIYQQ